MAQNSLHNLLCPYDNFDSLFPPTIKIPIPCIMLFTRKHSTEKHYEKSPCFRSSIGTFSDPHEFRLTMRQLNLYVRSSLGTLRTHTQPRINMVTHRNVKPRSPAQPVARSSRSLHIRFARLRQHIA